MIFLPKFGLKILILAALLTGSAVSLAWKSYGYGYRSAEQKWLVKWSRRDASDAALAQRREVIARAEENRRRQNIDKEAQHAQKKLAVVESDALRADVAVKRLQQALKQRPRLHAACLPLATAARPPDARQESVLAELLSESIEENRRLANQADWARTAGTACERAYEAVTQTH
jgi:hypothetical protein